MLRCLSLTSYHRVRVRTELDVALAALSRLKELWISPSLLISSTLNVIAHLPRLEIWSVYGEHTGIGPDFITSPSADAFPSLTTFASVSLQFSSILSISKAANPRHLRKLDVDTCCKESPQAWYRLIATVTSICPTIQVINVHGVWNNDGDPEQSPFSPFLSPTRYCSSLTSLRLVPAPRLHPTVETMRGLLTCLPALETLELDESQEPPTLPLFALSELAPLSMHEVLDSLYVFPLEVFPSRCGHLFGYHSS
ncbi:hypothetical protein CCMSSC00406_0009494 [Pleurotus cornucopiae]|uniref:Uncharacterized protein n=1 Tax=Pleurotus cornucopiae TaxID=5321 RepID=A0ACB7IUV0_PLECO|nr:hypothetical protein CCMSSC00406_0009494 [Pleurotus cornucopiae]